MQQAPNRMAPDSEFTDLVRCSTEVVRAFTKLPLLVTFEQQAQGAFLQVCLLKKRSEAPSLNSEDEYIKSLEKESRHALLDNINCDFEFYLVPIYRE